jgi:peptide/nickel transport system substrate-binding protein
MIAKSGFGRLVVYGAVVAALLLAAVPRGTAAAPVEQGRSRTFPETNQTVSGRFLEVWESQGDYATSLYINGFPITDKHLEVGYDDGKSYQTQWFERARFEEHPENQKPYDVLLGRLGAYAAEGRKDTPFKGIDKPASGTWFAETKHTISGAIETYWNKYGGLAQFGFPLSEQFTEVSKDDPSKSYTVQYFERQRFELHPENKGTQFEVLLGRLGAEQVGQAAEPARTYKEETGTAVDNIRIGMSQEPDSLFSATTTLYVSSIVLSPVENGLAYRDDKSVWHGDLAYFFPTVDNGGAFYSGTGRDQRLVVKYKLKRGVKWSDGVAFDSNDVIMGYRVYADPDVQVADRSVLDKISTVDNPDGYTVVVNYLTANEAAARIRTDAERFAAIKDFADKGMPVIDPSYNKNPVPVVYPAHLFKNFEGHFGDLVSSDLARKPVGTGPYMVKEWVPGVSITLEANPNYSVQPEKPRIKTLVFKIIPDTNQLLAQMKTGDIDVATEDALSLGQSTELDKLGDVGAKAYFTPAQTWEHADFNLDRPFFQDVKVRQAIAYGINRQDIVNKVLFGKTVPMDSWIPPSNAYSMMNPDMIAKFGTKFPLTKYNYDPDKAKSLLDQAGWTVGADGVRAKGGVKLSFKWSTTAANKTRADVTQIIQQQLKAIGVDMILDYVPAQQFFADDGPVYHRTGDVLHFAWVQGDDPSGQGLFDSTQIPNEGNNFSGQNIPGWVNAKGDDLIRRANSSISPKEREPLYAEQQQLWSQEVPQIALYARPNIAAAKNALSNFKPTGTNTPPTWNVQEWFMKK